ncbi:GspE/PulE family protein [Photobacterium leiognathi]|uniref:GspE/PulE family protein n=1 Tax=Photobacterium leiognathi TaxID=553611 RepID=UPI0029814329|nr:ATPase, T2SS/T4P/T4SS family [Photobacterium leiognathi]
MTDSATLQTLILSELSSAEKLAYQNEALLEKCKESTVGFISRVGTIYTHNINDPFVCTLIDDYMELEGSLPQVVAVTPQVIEDILQQPNDMLLADAADNTIGGVSSLFDDDDDETGLTSLEFNDLLVLAYTDQVADIHITVMSNGTLVRARGSNGLYRLHAVMKNRDYGLSIGNQVFTVLASEGSSGQFYETEPAENRFSWRINGKVRNYRASTMPIKNGCKINIRCLDPYSDTILTPDELGFTQNQISLLLNLMHLPSGGLLISGQTGSGKTTTLMSLLDVLPDSVNIHTIEDPVEWINPKFSQTEINMDGSKDEYGIYRGSFADFGKRLLRQDIDVAMFGEIRDELSCSIFYRLASTGHMTVGTVHTGSAVGCITMLIEFFHLSRAQVADADSFNAFLNQKLANKLCPKCCKNHADHKHEIETKLNNAISNNNFQLQWKYQKMMKEIHLAERFSNGDLESLRYHNTSGECTKCHGSGFYGKSVIAEILVLDNNIRDLIQKGDLLGIHKYLDSVGYQTTRDHAIQKIRSGLIDIHEACRLINEMDSDVKDSFNYSEIKNDMSTFTK